MSIVAYINVEIDTDDSSDNNDYSYIVFTK